VDKGVYVDQLARWMRVFPPLSFFVVTLEQWRVDPQRVFRRLLLFLGVPVSRAGLIDNIDRTLIGYDIDSSGSSYDGLVNSISRRRIVTEMMRDTARFISTQWGRHDVRRNSSTSTNVASVFEYRDSRNHSRFVDFSHQRLTRPNSLSEDDPMPEPLRRKLVEFYSSYNAKLVALLIEAADKISNSSSDS